MSSERIQRRIDRLLDQAEEAMDRLDWASVRDVAKVVLGLDPDNNDALAFLASVEQVLKTEPDPTSSQSTNTWSIELSNIFSEFLTSWIELANKVE